MLQAPHSASLWSLVDGSTAPINITVNTKIWQFLGKCRKEIITCAARLG